ncbi:hypothetical protein RI367_000578 [Sorochytrium milnesiophthora]
MTDALCDMVGRARPDLVPAAYRLVLCGQRASSFPLLVALPTLEKVSLAEDVYYYKLDTTSLSIKCFEKTSGFLHKALKDHLAIADGVCFLADVTTDAGLQESRAEFNKLLDLAPSGKPMLCVYMQNDEPSATSSDTNVRAAFDKQFLQDATPLPLYQSCVVYLNATDGPDVQGIWDGFIAAVRKERFRSQIAQADQAQEESESTSQQQEPTEEGVRPGVLSELIAGFTRLWTG